MIFLCWYNEIYHNALYDYKEGIVERYEINYSDFTSELQCETIKSIWQKQIFLKSLIVIVLT